MFLAYTKKPFRKSFSRTHNMKPIRHRLEESDTMRFYARTSPAQLPAASYRHAAASRSLPRQSHRRPPPPPSTRATTIIAIVFAPRRLAERAPSGHLIGMVTHQKTRHAQRRTALTMCASRLPGPWPCALISARAGAATATRIEDGQRGASRVAHRRRRRRGRAIRRHAAPAEEERKMARP